MAILMSPPLRIFDIAEDKLEYPNVMTVLKTLPLGKEVSDLFICL
jgi:hypothetical protein